MKISDEKLTAFLKQNPDAENIPVAEVQETEQSKSSDDFKDAFEQINGLSAKIDELSKLVEQLKSIDKEDTSAKAIEELQAEVKNMKEESQRQAQSEATIPQEPTADDVIRKFITGGK